MSQSPASSLGSIGIANCMGGAWGMNGVFFFYTVAMLALCVAIAVSSLAAWASTRRRLFFYSAGAFVCYAIELTEIFFHEYISQNKPFPM